MHTGFPSPTVKRPLASDSSSTRPPDFNVASAASQSASLSMTERDTSAIAPPPKTRTPALGTSQTSYVLYVENSPKGRSAPVDGLTPSGPMQATMPGMMSCLEGSTGQSWNVACVFVNNGFRVRCSCVAKFDTIAICFPFL